ncbi:MAG: phosphoribosylaminoimidazolecarboxamide formyltransferase [Rhodospirillaceae bacterium]|nr:phosphoribosylaminoimidazolecarboxamide formyltransferase [Rhodospirillaceae bacterium]
MANHHRREDAGLEELGSKIDSFRKELDGPSKKAVGTQVAPNLVGLAMRAGVELFAGVAVGAGVGYGLDRWLETGPWLLIVCFIIGAAAGMVNVYRAINGVGMAVGYSDEKKNN